MNIYPIIIVKSHKEFKYSLKWSFRIMQNKQSSNKILLIMKGTLLMNKIDNNQVSIGLIIIQQEDPCGFGMNFK